MSSDSMSPQSLASVEQVMNLAFISFALSLKNSTLGELSSFVTFQNGTLDKAWIENSSDLIFVPVARSAAAVLCQQSGSVAHRSKSKPKLEPLSILKALRQSELT